METASECDMKEVNRLFKIFELELEQSNETESLPERPLPVSEPEQGPSDDLAKSIFLSLDLNEATYNMSHDLLRKQTETLDVILEGFAPWLVFRDVFTTFDRLMDLSDLKDHSYWAGAQEVMTRTGSFMGDVMSFIHLSLFLRGAVIASEGEFGRPLGQSVGDDLVLLGVRRETADRFTATMSGLGGKFSKINSISDDSLTFCENYAVRPNDGDGYLVYPKGSKFGDLFFLDIVKGSLLTGKSKVKTVGSNPFFGHARMLNKQIEWHPVPWVKERAKTFLWAVNFHSARKLASAGASLPRSLGGIELAIGPIAKFEDPEFQKSFLPYYVSIANVSDDNAFFAFYTLLQGVYKAEPKGLPYENRLDRLDSILPKLNWRRVGNVNHLLPPHMLEEPIQKRLRYLGRELHMASISWLVEEVSRRAAFQDFWNQVRSDGFVTLPIKEPTRRWQAAWIEIRRNFDPAPKSRWPTSMAELKQMFDHRCWNVYFDKEDEAISEALGDCPSLYVDMGVGARKFLDTL